MSVRLPVGRDRSRPSRRVLAETAIHVALMVAVAARALLGDSADRISPADLSHGGGAAESLIISARQNS
jgi:hypothetical protein